MQNDGVVEAKVLTTKIVPYITIWCPSLALKFSLAHEKKLK